MLNKIYRKAKVLALIIIFLCVSANSITGFKINNNKICLKDGQSYKDFFYPIDFIFNLPTEANKILKSNFVYNIGQSVQQTEGNGYIVTGFRQEFDFGNPTSEVIQNTILMKKNVNGEGEWRKTFKFMDGNMGYSIQQTDDKGYIIGGSATSSYISYALLLKTDEYGNEEWTKTYTGLENAMAYSVQQTADNGFILTGSSSSSYDENITYLLLLKTDESGNLEWNKTFYYDKVSTGYSVEQTEDMGFIITGYTGKFEFKPGTQNIDFKVLILKTDVNGDEEWSKIQEIMDIGIGFSVKQTADKGYIIGGTTVDISSYTSYALLLKMDELGHEQWRKTFSDKYGNSVQQTADNGYIIGGIAISSSKSYAMLLKTDENGNEKWTKTYKGLGISLGTSVQQTVDNGYILTGATTGSIYSLKIYVFLLKTDENGNLIWSKSLTKNIPKFNCKNNFFRISQNTFLHKFFEKFPVIKRLFINLVLTK